LERFAAQDIERCRTDGFKPELLEEPLSGELAGLSLRGRPDRVDVSSDGRLRVVDYKTSTPSAASLERQIAALKNHQFPVYLELAGGRLKASSGAGARLCAIEDSAETTGVSGLMDLSEEAWSRLREPYLRRLAALGAMIAAGRFIITPDEDRGGPCPRCRFAGLCRKSHPPTRRRAEESEAARELSRLLERAPAAVSAAGEGA
jgi:RecB family exonuclease